ncbi:membrane transporter [Oryctes borbonicus]|uniref:Membrane transporter n=1 Tax=Oryctes borbonicus TaxID=1629725 RepID=A0A0T6BH34_9SCAR|nr:membrane transporter [Oryctes borbonicus]
MVHGLFASRSKLLLSVGTADLVALTTGIMLAWSSPILEKLSSSGDENPLASPITASEKSWIGSLLALGAALGPFPFAYIQDKFGRKYALLVVAIPFIIACLMSAFATHVSMFIVLRVIAGISVAGVFTVLPTYIAEVSDSAVRGMLGSSMNNFLCFGLVISYCIGPYLPIMWFNIIAAIFPVTFLVLFFMFIPDSPYFLMGKDRNQAESALAFLRSKPVSEVQTELKEIERSVEESKANAATFMDIFKSKGTTKALIISVLLCVFQQLSGINIVLFYAQTIFEASGTVMESTIPPMIIGAVQFLSSFVTPILVDVLGRKVLLLGSAVGMVISEAALGVYFFLKNDGTDVDAISFLPILTLVIYIISYNCGFGPLPWTVMAELFPSNIKSAAASFTVFCCWFVSFILTYFFDSVSEAIGMGGSFWIFAGFTVVAFIFTLVYVPETKGRSFQEIQSILNS